MKKLLIIFILLFPVVTFANFPMILSGYNFTKGQIVTVEVDSLAKHIVILRVYENSSQIEVNLIDIEPGEYNTIVEVRNNVYGPVVERQEFKIKIKDE